MHVTLLTLCKVLPLILYLGGALSRAQTSSHQYLFVKKEDDIMDEKILKYLALIKIRK